MVSRMRRAAVRSIARNCIRASVVNGKRNASNSVEQFLDHLREISTLDDVASFGLTNATADRAGELRPDRLLRRCRQETLRRGDIFFRRRIDEFVEDFTVGHRVLSKVYNVRAARRRSPHLKSGSLVDESADLLFALQHWIVADRHLALRIGGLGGADALDTA